MGRRTQLTQARQGLREPQREETSRSGSAHEAERGHGMVWGPLWALALAATLAGLMVGPLAARTAASRLTQSYPAPYQCDPASTPCARVANALIRADIGPVGTWALGTTGGDPDTPSDDDRDLLYGFEPGGASQVASTFTTVRLRGSAGQFDSVPKQAALQRTVGDRVETAWSWENPYALRVTETFQITLNPFSSRQDVVDLGYEVHNPGSAPVEVGIRSLLDIKLGTNDGAPYFIPGVGTVSTEQDYTGAAIPAFWQAFESPTYDPNQLRSVGILRGPEVTEPDRFLIADWVRIQNTEWEYAIHPTVPVTSDSAVALYWEPRGVPPGQGYRVNTQYGIASNKGGNAFLSAPVQAECRTTFPVALFINNFDALPLTGGQATIGLPEGLKLPSGETATKSLGEIKAGGTGSVAWQVEAAAAGVHEVVVTAVFDSGRSFEARSTVTVHCTAPTPTPISPPTATPTPTQLPSPTSTTTSGSPSPTPVPGKACDFILTRVPPAVINDALANPTRIRGWGELANPSAPPSPFNQPKSWLSLLNIAAPYHPLYNPVIFKAGCP